MIFKDKETIVFAGDSITDMDKAKPYGEEAGLGQGLGEGYVHMFSDMMMATYPEIDLRILNAGISGNTSAQLLSRWQEDVLEHKPDYVSICIGVNDVLNGFIYPAVKKMQVSLEEYKANLTQMITSAKENGAKAVMVISPFTLEQCEKDPIRKEMDIYRTACESVAKEMECEYIDVQAMFDRYSTKRHQCTIAWDRVHPNRFGGYMIAREFLKHCGFDYDHE